MSQEDSDRIADGCIYIIIFVIVVGLIIYLLYRCGECIYDWVYTPTEYLERLRCFAMC